ncbi:MULTISPECIES: helix-turn-helix domain-containing protein [Haloferax]|uniref:HTH DNA-binding protein n=2 Tax=Haloferax TaxID=2251 RepID=M0J9V4_9EURY|nr:MULTISPECIES: helix-turn-helix domain-containing protein [Haloferax]EMA05771.1 HTH DNA-binding protein [Haloferax denitrificans ATCC 35960]GGC50723.1 helix-turn-helix domain-containing protein [Haloferax sulfurifontis]
MYEATLRIDHQSPYADVTLGKDVHVEMWCNQYCDLVYVSGSDIETPVETFDDTVGIQEIVYKDEEAVLITDSCLLDYRDNLLEGYLQPHQCLSLPPLTYSDGALFARVLALTEEQLSGVYHSISDSHRVTVEAKREIRSIAPDIPILMLDSALPTLSDGQQRALSLAVEMGYYEIPRGSTTGEIADEMGVSRRTFEEHLRRAENKIIKNLLRYFLT